MTIVLPIYYTQELKMKANKTSLVGMNLYRNAHYFLQNAMKKHFQELVLEQLPPVEQQLKQFTVDYKIYYKSPVCDGSNIVALIEKFYLDAIKTHGLISDDNVNYHVGSTWSVAGKDAINPRVVVTITEIAIKEIK